MKMSVSKESKHTQKKTDVSEGTVRPSLSLHMIRHAESGNNPVYRNARYIYRGGTPDFDEEGWINYVETHRRADPDLSELGYKQAEKLSEYLVPHLANQASCPVRILTSPMKRTLLTIRPTLEKLQKAPTTHGGSPKCHVKVVGFYHESEGCHTHDKPEEGMNPQEISELLDDCVEKPDRDIDFVGFPEPDRGWYVHGKGAETRVESEERAAKFFMWLCEYLDDQLKQPQEDVFDAGVAIPGEEDENDHDKLSPRQRPRRTVLLIGHGDFMSLVLKRIAAGFGHWVENEGIPHRSAFVHFNTAITSLEYFGQGRFLVMTSNHTPHFHPDEYTTLRSGGSLLDGWSYLMPNDEFILHAEVSVAFLDEVDEHVREQTQALKSLYLSSQGTKRLHADNTLQIEEHTDPKTSAKNDHVHFIVQRGLQVVGCAAYDETTGQLFDVALRPSAEKEVAETLMKAVKDHARKEGRSGNLLVRPRSAECAKLFQQLGFTEKSNVQPADDVDTIEMELKH